MRSSFIAVLIFCLAATSAWAVPSPHPANAEIQSTVAQISADSIFATINRLAQFHTRHTYSDTTGDSVGIGAAIRYVQGKGQSYDPDEDFSWEQFPWVGYFNGNDVTRHVLIARLSGSEPSPARYVIGGHLDSRTVSIGDNTTSAPGADDNGSSSAALLEMLRLLPDTLRHDLELIWFTGEEEGLLGSAAYANYLSQQDARVDGMIAMDMISHIALPGGAIDTTSLRLYAQGPGESSSRNLQRYTKWVGEDYADLDSFQMVIFAATDRPGRGSDHMSFSGVGYPALRVIERNEDLAYQHNANDRPEFVSPTYARRVAMCTYGALLTMLRAPERPSSLIAEQVAADRVHVTIPDSITLPPGGKFYAASRHYYNNYFDEIVDLGETREYEFTVAPGPLYAFSVSRADSNDLPSPFSNETLVNILSADGQQVLLPTETAFSAAPNPFNSEIVFQLDLMESGHLKLELYDLLGRHVETLVNDKRNAGSYHVSWRPERLASGIYFARMLVGEDLYMLKVAYVR